MGLKHSSSCYSNNCLEENYDDKNSSNEANDFHTTHLTTNNTLSSTKDIAIKDIQEIDNTFDEIIQTSLHFDDDNVTDKHNDDDHVDEKHSDSHDKYMMELGNDSDSNESVLTAISPTKERQIRFMIIYIISTSLIITFIILVLTIIIS